MELEHDGAAAAADEFADLAAQLAENAVQLDGLFPDLVLATPVDLDSAIRSLQLDVRGPEDEAPALRTVDMETLRAGGKRNMASLMPEMLELTALDTPVVARKHAAKKPAPPFDADALAQAVVEVAFFALLLLLFCSKQPFF